MISPLENNCNKRSTESVVMQYLDPNKNLKNIALNLGPALLTGSGYAGTEAIERDRETNRQKMQDNYMLLRSGSTAKIVPVTSHSPDVKKRGVLEFAGLNRAI